MEQNKEIRHYHHIGSDEELRNSYEFLRKMERSGQTTPNSSITENNTKNKAYK